MRYSVYDYTRRVYDYYDAPGPSGTHAGSPPVARTRGDVGVAPDRASWRLPAGASRVGSGAMPQGRIATLAGADLVSGLLDDPMRLAVAGAALYMIWRIWR